MARRKALVVGVEHYHDSSLSNLPAAGTDARKIAQVLESQCEFDVTRLENPTRDQFGRETEDFFGDKSLLSEDMLLLYFAGHGLDSDSMEDFFLACSDTDPSYPSTSAINAKTIKDHLVNTYAKTKVIFLDSCFSGHMGEGLRSRSGGRVRMQGPLDHSGTFVLTATDKTTYAFEDPRAEGDGALFTKSVLEALSGDAKDSDGDGWISVQDVADFVQRSEEVTSQQKPRAYSDSVSGPIRLARIGAPTEPIEEAPTASAIHQHPEPHDDPHAPLDKATWRKLLRYYVGCLKREAGLSDWIQLNDRDRSALWKGGSEQVFSGPPGPVRLPAAIAKFAQENTDAEYIYGYPLVLVKKNSKPRFAPLIISPITIVDGSVEAGVVEINRIVVEDLGLEAGDIDQLAKHFTKEFRPGNHERLAQQLKGIANAVDLPVVEEPNPQLLSEHLRTAPFIGGIHNLAVVWRADGTKSAVSKLVKDLGKHAMENVGAFGQTALSALARRDNKPVAPMPELVAPGPLNESQEAVVKAAMTQRLTVATGPPGTGKTALVAALTATAEAAGQSVLIGSSNHRAVDGVHEKLDDIAPGMLIRTGPKDLQMEEPAKLNELLSSIPPAPVDERIAASRIRTQRKHILQSRDAINERSEAEADLLAVHRRLARLLPTHNSTALSVLGSDDSSLEKAFRLADHSLRRWPWGVLARLMLRFRFDTKNKLDRLHLAELFAAELNQRELRAKLDDLPDPNSQWESLKKFSREWTANCGDYSRALTSRRLREGDSAIRARASQMSQGASWKEFKQVLPYLPGWAVNGHSSLAIMPQPAIFDLVIIDEAAQCATPYVLALLVRAKRALIIGDPNQLQPVVNLSKAEDEELRRANGLGHKWMSSRNLGFVGESIYSACSASVREELLLDEHYRCDPSIVSAPNRFVYQNRLTVLTDRKSLALPAEPPSYPAVEVIDVPGEVQRPRSGSCHNRIEAEQVVTQTAKLINERDDISIGIVTPFKAQVSLIATQLKQSGIEERVAVGTIHTFQGGEYDVIVLSPVASEGIWPGLANWVRSDTNLWNVAITRAKSRLLIVGDASWWSRQSGLLTELVGSGETDLAVTPGDTELVDLLQEALEEAGVSVVARDTTVAGQPCHLLVECGSTHTAIYVDDASVPDGKRHRQLLSRLDLMKTEGHQAIRVPAWRILAEPGAIVRELGESPGS